MDESVTYYIECFDTGRGALPDLVLKRKGYDRAVWVAQRLAAAGFTVRMWRHDDEGHRLLGFVSARDDMVVGY